jgi:hypothetical protein
MFTLLWLSLLRGLYAFTGYNNREQDSRFGRSSSRPPSTISFLHSDRHLATPQSSIGIAMPFSKKGLATGRTYCLWTYVFLLT